MRLRTKRKRAASTEHVTRGKGRGKGRGSVTKRGTGSVTKRGTGRGRKAKEDDAVARVKQMVEKRTALVKVMKIHSQY